MSNLTSMQNYPLNIPMDLELDILRTVVKGKTNEEENGNLNTIRLVCKQWNEWSVDLLSTPALFRRLQYILHALPEAKIHIPHYPKLAGRVSDKLNPLTETVFLTMQLHKIHNNKQRLTTINSKRVSPTNLFSKMSAATVKETLSNLEVEIRKQSVLEQTIQAKLCKSSQRQETVNLPNPVSIPQIENEGEQLLEERRKSSSKAYAFPRTVEAMYSNNQTEMLLDIIDIRRFDLLTLAVIYRIPFDKEKIAGALLSAPELHAAVYIGLMIKMHCFSKDFLLENHMTLNALLTTHFYNIPLIIRDFKISDLFEYRFNIAFTKILFNFLTLIQDQMLGKEIVALVPETSHSVYKKEVPPGSLWETLNHSAFKVAPSPDGHNEVAVNDLWETYQSPELKQWIQVEPCSREKYKEIIVAIFNEIKFDNLTTIESVSHHLGPNKREQFLDFLKECIEEYRKGKPSVSTNSLTPTPINAWFFLNSNEGW